MNRSLYLFFLSTLALNFMSCEKGSVKYVDTISYGSSFGMCIGYCNNMLSISNEKVTYIQKMNGQNPATKTCTSTLSAIDVKDMKDLIKDSDFSTLPKTIGCPDCADGGAEWVSVTDGSKEYKVVFEYGKAPKELTAVVSKFRKLKETFENCGK
jgi:hypothetical protein